MALRWGIKSALFFRRGVSNPRQFSLFVKPRELRVTSPMLRYEVSQKSFIIPRRTLFGRRKKQPETATESVTETAKTVGKICYRFTTYSAGFIIIAVAGFFIYDVTFSFSLFRFLQVVSNVSSSGTTERSPNPLFVH